MLVILQTFAEDNESTTHCLNSLLKEVAHSDAERRANGIRLLSSIANNDIYPFIYTHVLKGMNDLNPFVRRCAYAGLLKLRRNTEFGATQPFAADDDESEADDEVSSDDLCLRLLSNALHNLTEEEQEVGGQAIKPEDNENVLAVAAYLLDQIIDEEHPAQTEAKFRTLHPVFVSVLEKLDEVDEVFVSQIVPVLIKYTKRYMGRTITEARNSPYDDLALNKAHRKVLECILNALSGLDNPAAVLALCQFYLIVSPISRMHEIMGHLIRIFKECEIVSSTENELIGYSALHFIEVILKNKQLLSLNPKILKNFTSLRFIKSLFLKTNQSLYYCSKKL